jgi:hypothetical protein
MYGKSRVWFWSMVGAADINTLFLADFPEKIYLEKLPFSANRPKNW